jgi:acetyl esterase/lipase
MSDFHPELLRSARLIPRFAFTPRLASFARFVQRLRGLPKPPQVAGLDIRDVFIAGPESNPALRLRVYSPISVTAGRPALLWIHGGGFIIGTPEQDAANIIEMCQELGIVVAAVNYRLGPDHPFPAALDDCYAALKWLHKSVDDLNTAQDRIAIGGNSAGAGLAAGLVLAAHDRDEVSVAFQLLFYPMLDDRTTLREGVDQSRFRMWNSKSNAVGWSSYLGRVPGEEGVSEYAAPARRKETVGLPPTWIGVGTCDLFHEENVAYARKLADAGVPCTLKVVEGAFHAFDLINPKVQVVQDFKKSYLDAMRETLFAASRG